MKTGTGAWGFFLALGALVVGSARANAETHVTHATHLESRTATLSAAPPRAEALPVHTGPVMATAPSDVAPQTAIKLRRMRKAEISPAMLGVAAQVIKQHYTKPAGTQIPVDVDGQHLVARIEVHYHPEGGPAKPWGYHHGVSLFCER